MLKKEISVEFRLLGPFSVRQNGQHISNGLTGPALQILAYMLTFPDQSLRREWLAEQIWPPEHPVSKQAFNTALWRLKKFLAQMPEVELRVQKDVLRLQVGASVKVDSYALEATQLISADAETQLSQQDAQSLQHAVDSWRGPFMDGANQEWILVSRERYHAAYTRALCMLMRHTRRGKCFAKALDYGLQIMVEDPFWESVHCEVLCLLVLTGQRARALKQHMKFCALLQKELGIGPTAETAALASYIRGGMELKQTPNQIDADKTKSVASSQRLHGFMRAVEESRAAIYEALQHMHPTA